MRSFRAASASRSACVNGFSLDFSFRASAAFIMARVSSRLRSFSFSLASVASLFATVCFRIDMRTGPSSSVGSHDALSDFFLGRGGASVGDCARGRSSLTFLRVTAATRAVKGFVAALRFLFRSCRSALRNSFSPASSSSAPSSSSSDDDESML